MHYHLLRVPNKHPIFLTVICSSIVLILKLSQKIHVGLKNELFRICFLNKTELIYPWQRKLQAKSIKKKPNY